MYICRYYASKTPSAYTIYYGVRPSLLQELKRAAPASGAGGASAAAAAAAVVATEAIKGEPEPLLAALHGCVRQLARLRDTLLVQVSYLDDAEDYLWRGNDNRLGWWARESFSLARCLKREKKRCHASGLLTPPCETFRCLRKPNFEFLQPGTCRQENR